MSAPTPATALTSASPERNARRAGPTAGRPPSRVGSALVLLAAVSLEAFPVAAWLILLAASTGDVRHAALPLWWLYGVILLASLVSLGFGALVGPQPTSGPQRGRAIFGAIVLLGWAASVVLSLALSPSAYLGQSLPRAMVSFAADVGTGNVRIGADVGLALLAAYLWWRGLALTQQPIYRDRVYVRFLIGMGAIIFAIAGAAAFTGGVRVTLVTALLLLLLAQVFVGLVGLALAHIADTERERRERRPLALGEDEAAPVINRAWIATALGISSLVIVLALGLALILSYDSLRALVSLLRPLAAALAQAIAWLAEAIAFLLFLVLNPLISWLQSFLAQNHKSRSSTPAQRPGPPKAKVPPPQLSFEWLFAGRLVLIGLVVLVVAFVLLRLLRRYAALREQQGFEEDREALDAGALLGQQLRDLFARRGTPTVPAEESLAPGTVRYLYRELLRIAGRTGHPRRASETPDEYARRLPGELPATPEVPGTVPGQREVEDALADLTGAYDAARYGGAPQQAPASPSVASAWQAILRRLAGGDGGRRRRRGVFRRSNRAP
jgi:hypothetical protein